MDKKKTQHLRFIHRFIPPNKKEAIGGRAKGKTPHVTLLLLHVLEEMKKIWFLWGPK
jgi:hypothetical protein